MKETPISRKLDLGCGNSKRAGAIGVDGNVRTSADVVHDLNSFPYPFPNSSFNEIYMDNVLEHLDDVLRVMEEVHRISEPNGLVKVIVPYFRSPYAFLDPTHRHFFTVNSFAYFDPANPVCKRYDYTLARFAVEKIVFNENIPGRITKRIMRHIANKWPLRYELYISQLYPLDDITYYLRALK
ncbi:MAG: methyltransferase domain-containing protein [Nitrospinae bacterium]|nr:methyltransferase domain-containing protein [Nitrospinota bacterium]